MRIMAHHAVRSSYESLVERLNRLPQGAPPSDTLYAILKLLFSEKEAGLVAQLPIRAFTAGNAAQIWKMKPSEAQKVLDELASNVYPKTIPLSRPQALPRIAPARTSRG